MTDEKRPQDGVRAEPSPAKGEDEVRPEAPPPEGDSFFDNDEHDGWAPIRRRVEDPEPPG